MAMAADTRMVARRVHRPASRPRAVVETAGRVFMAMAPNTRMAARRSHRPASRPRALIETGGRIFICRPRALLWPQWERPHAHARGIVEIRRFVPEKQVRCNPAANPPGVHSYVEN